MNNSETVRTPIWLVITIWGLILVGGLFVFLSVFTPYVEAISRTSANVDWLKVFQLLGDFGASFIASGLILYAVDSAVLKHLRGELTRGIYYSLYGLSVDDNLRKEIDKVIYRSSNYLRTPFTIRARIEPVDDENLEFVKLTCSYEFGLKLISSRNPKTIDLSFEIRDSPIKNYDAYLDHVSGTNLAKEPNIKDLRKEPIIRNRSKKYPIKVQLSDVTETTFITIRWITYKHLADDIVFFTKQLADKVKIELEVRGIEKKNLEVGTSLGVYQVQEDEKERVLKRTSGRIFEGTIAGPFLANHGFMLWWNFMDIPSERIETESTAIQNIVTEQTESVEASR